MVKKKQPDFQPTRLRVGKHLPKGRNVTNTSFKSKKIVTKDQKLKVSVNVSLSDLLRLTRVTNVAGKVDGLKKIIRYIEKHDSSLSTYFTEILSAIGKLFLDLNSKVREETLNVIKIAADILSDLQFSSFRSVLTSHISCMMTHIDLSIKKDSLNLLSFLLKTHPNFIGHSTRLLKNLLNMISSDKACKKADSFNQNKRKLDDNINTTITSVEWRNQVLKLIAEVLENLVNVYAKDKQLFEDEQKVHYDGKKPLFIQLYAGGGLTPTKLGNPSDLRISKNQVTEELKPFFADLVSVVSDVVTEEVAGLNVSQVNNTFRPDNIDHLNTVTQVLCCVANWYTMEDSQIEDKMFIQQMNNILRKKLMKGFIYKVHESARGRRFKEGSCTYLNLGISSLYCSLILGTEFENAVLEERILFVLADVLNNVTYQEIKTVSFTLGIIKRFLKVASQCESEEMNKYNAVYSIIFQHLCEIADKSGDKALIKEIHSFFIELSLDYNYKFLLDYNILHCWISHAFKHIKKMHKDKKIDKTLIKCINLMCSREYPSFIMELNSTNPHEIVGCLKLNNEEYQLTVINLITHLTNLSPNFLQNVADLILTDENLSLDIICKLIRSLYNRFADKRVNEEEYGEFLKFLLNVSFDMVSVENAMNKYTNEYFQRMNAISIDGESSEEQEEQYSFELIQILYYVQSGCAFVVVPSEQWERHSKIFEVCLECLVIPQDREATMDAATSLFSELKRSKFTFPVHSAISLLKLASYVYLFEDFCIPHKEALIFSEELMCCSLYYISIVTHKEQPENVKAMAVSELQHTLGLNNINAYNLMQLLASRMYEQAGVDNLTLLHILRIMKFLMVKKKISSEILMEFREIFRIAEVYCAAESEHHAIMTQIFELYQEHRS